METKKLMDEIDLILQTSRAGTMSTSVSYTWQLVNFFTQNLCCI